MSRPRGSSTYGPSDLRGTILIGGEVVLDLEADHGGCAGDDPSKEDAQLRDMAKMLCPTVSSRETRNVS